MTDATLYTFLALENPVFSSISGLAQLKVEGTPAVHVPARSLRRG